MNTVSKGLLIAIVMLSYFIACTPTQEEDDLGLSILNIGILPDEGKAKLLGKYTPLFEYLSSEVGIPYKLIIPENYKELMKMFDDKKIDLAYLGGLTCIQSNINSGAIPLVMRDVDTRFTSYFITNNDHADLSLPEFKGKSLSFGSRLSTSGHLMPRYFLNKIKMFPEEFFSDVSYSGKHDKTAYLVRDGEVDLGVANSLIIREMLNDGRLKKGDVQIIWETPPYPDYVWVLRPLLNKNLEVKLRDAFLNLSKMDLGHAKILKGLGAGSFMPASIGDFSKLIDAATELQMIGGKYGG